MTQGDEEHNDLNRTEQSVSLLHENRMYSPKCKVVLSLSACTKPNQAFQLYFNFQLANIHDFIYLL